MVSDLEVMCIMNENALQFEIENMNACFVCFWEKTFALAIQ